jgi:prepilin-type N-terminal cleavage/methylation domain-containing protein/prepilin-type processing-associated H-X9-DG protein
MRRAFTLIELLVVIAIIAILAAILFPVFAQAKDAAKKTASLSNIKEQDIGMLMYNGDNDDMAVVAVDYTWSDWCDKIQPYIKSWALIFSPAGGPHMISSWMEPQYDWWANWRWFSQYGYNAVYMNRANGDCSNMGQNNQAFGPPISMTSPQDPANTISFAEDAQDTPQDNVGTSLVYPPGAYTDDESCSYGDWGNNGTGTFWYPAGGGTTTTTKMGFFRPRHAGGGVVAFVDGHVKYMKPGQVAAGTDWNINTSVPGNINILDRTKYLWDIW